MMDDNVYATNHMDHMDDHDHDHDPEIDEDPLADPPEAELHEGGRRNSWRSRISEVQFPLVVVAAASVVLLIAVWSWEPELMARGYVFSVPSLSLAIALLSLLLTVYREDLYAIYGQHLAHVLFLWNFTGACFLTFVSPFTTTGNGYFAAWGCMATSAMAMGLTADAVRSRIKGLGSLMGLCASAIIVLIALFDFLGTDVPAYLKGETLYAVVVSCFTIILCIGLMYFQKRHEGSQADSTEVLARFFFLSLFALLWFALAFLVTFRGPFVTTGNGYFASWCGAVCACSAAFNAKKEAATARAQFLHAYDATGLSATIT